MNIKDLISPYIGSRYQKTGEIILTESQLKAIIREASQPLVEALKSVQMELWEYGYQDDSRDRVQVILRDSIEQFNKEYVE